MYLVLRFQPIICWHRYYLHKRATFFNLLSIVHPYCFRIEDELKNFYKVSYNVSYKRMLDELVSTLLEYFFSKKNFITLSLLNSSILVLHCSCTAGILFFISPYIIVSLMSDILLLADFYKCIFLFMKVRDFFTYGNIPGNRNMAGLPERIEKFSPQH